MLFALTLLHCIISRLEGVPRLLLRYEAFYRSLELFVSVAKGLILVQDWKTERYKEIIKSGSVRMADFVGRKVLSLYFSKSFSDFPSVRPSFVTVSSRLSRDLEF